jgi:DNA-binding GntR family transcriptional regulator
MVGYGPVMAQLGAVLSQDVAVDRNSDVPPYRQIADRLREQIRAGELAPRSRLPSIERLVQEDGVARLTARKALGVLVDEGYARRVSGLGTFVVPADQMPKS